MNPKMKEKGDKTQISLYVDKEKWTKFREICTKEYRTPNQTLVMILDQWLESR